MKEKKLWKGLNGRFTEDSEEMVPQRRFRPNNRGDARRCSRPKKEAGGHAGGTRLGTTRLRMHWSNEGESRASISRPRSRSDRQVGSTENVGDPVEERGDANARSGRARLPGGIWCDTWEKVRGGREELRHIGAKNYLGKLSDDFIYDTKFTYTR